MSKIVVINASPRDDSVSYTYRALQAEIEFLKSKDPELEVMYYKLPKDMNGCFNCKNCQLYCCQRNDNFKEIVYALEQADTMLLGSPVYLDMPTPQAVAFLTRLNCMAENTDRTFFEGKKAMLLATSWCSGTKTCIHTMMGACEMLGFTIDGRSTREYIRLWYDEKVRGGMHKEDSIYLKKQE